MKILFLILFLSCTAYSQSVYTLNVDKNKTPEVWSYFAKDDDIQQEQYQLFTDLKTISFVTNTKKGKFWYAWNIVPEDVQKKILKVSVKQ